MVFSSALFLILFLPLFLAGYYLLPQKLRNPWLLTASIFFYTWGAPKFIFIVLASIVADYFLVRHIALSGRSRKRWLIGISLGMNIGLLAYFKYANFFVDNFNSLLNIFGIQQVGWTAIALPIGISFFTFQKITYAVDVYRNVHKPLHRLTDYAMYILMFPHLIAGPIVRFNLVADQIEDRKYNETLENHLMGFFRFVIGLSKKVLIANVLGTEADRIFAMEAGEMSTGIAWIGVLAYAFQIYFDFSGYSDMAIGLALMIGFNFPENFNNPYISRNITEFWRRWHMTLGRFMREYLYIPLGGNRVRPARLYFNLWLVFLLSGLWHGAAWNFVAWGAFHGLFLVADRLFLVKFLEKLGKIPAILFTFFVTLIGWVLFRAETLSHALGYLKAMFSFRSEGVAADLDLKFRIILGLAVVFSFMAAFKNNENWQMKVLNNWTGGSFGPGKPYFSGAWKLGFSVAFFVLCLAAVISSGFNPFISFRF
jgi:alginate O-acetyltransferase complex protein AlgI